MIGLNRYSRLITCSPAFKANILTGDVVVQIADQEVLTPEDFSQLLDVYAGKTVAIVVIRGSNRMSVDVRLNPASK